VGDLLPPLKRILTNVVVKHVKKMVPPWQLAGAMEFNRVLTAGRAQSLDEVALTHDDVAFLQYTGGTTGVAKGAMLTHGNMVANVLQVGAWMSPNLHDGAETVVIPLPLYHVFALTGCLSFFSKGAQTVLIANPRDLPAFIKSLRQISFSAIIGVNTLFRALLDAPDSAKVDWVLNCGGRRHGGSSGCASLKQMTGVPLVEGCGLTESARWQSPTPSRLQVERTVGLPCPVRPRRSRRRWQRTHSGSGEICLRGRR
jgi:long-chain acyl-CoA synthetase